MLLVLSSPNFCPRIASISRKSQDPVPLASNVYLQDVRSGGWFLLSYGADCVAMHRLAASYVAKIPRELHLPIFRPEQTDRSELVINSSDRRRRLASRSRSRCCCARMR